MNPIALPFSESPTPCRDREALAWLLAQAPPGAVLEIGCHLGQTTLYLATIFDRFIYALDWSGKSRMHPDQQGEHLCHEQIGQFVRDHKRVQILDQDSATLDYRMFDALALVFIDGDHTLSAVKTDTEKALNYFANRRGFIAWHDYGNDLSWIGVRPYLSQLPIEPRLQWVQGTWLAFLECPVDR